MIEQLTFAKKLDEALERAGAVLEDSIRPVKVESMAHQYSDKFVVAESVSALCVEAMVAVFESALRLPEEKGRSGGKCVKFESGETCEYVRETVREVKGPKTTFTSEQSGKFYGTSKHKITTETTTHVTEHVWQHRFWYKFSLANAKDQSAVETLIEGAKEQTLQTVSKESPPKQTKTNAPEVIDVKALAVATQIDRSKASCKTPRRNDEVDACLSAFDRVRQFALRVCRQFPGNANVDGVFSPPACVGLGDDCRPFSPFDREALVREMLRTFDERAANAKPDDLLGPEEMRILVALLLLQTLAADYARSVDYLESLLYDQLSAAIGKSLTPEDFAEYVVFHDRQLFAPEFRPAHFAFAVRRSAESFPDGELCLAQRGSTSGVSRTLCRRVETRSEMRFARGATTFRFDGESFAHAYVARTFAAQRSPTPLELTARARQFSSFLVMIGTLVGPDEFAPEHAVIVKNKDEVVIPLLLEPIPTPKEFADAIESLSPEQQAFCRAFRKKQLASTLFAVLVVQLKPQVEKVLNLDPGALTKEIQLTETLMDLFIEYQIPTSMLSYDGAPDAAPRAKIDAVKAHAAQIQTMIDDARKRDLELTAQQAVHRRLATDRVSVCADEDDQVEEDWSSPPSNEEGLFDSAATLGGGMQLQPSQLYSMRKKGAKPAPVHKLGFGGRGRRSVAASFGAVKESAFGAPPPEILRACLPPPAPNAAAPRPGGGGGGAVPVAPRREEEPPVTQPPVVDRDWDDVGYDLTALPQRLDENFKILDTDSQLRPTTIKPQTPWTKRYKKSILAETATEFLDQSALDREKARAFDLLDALTRSGALSLESTSLHVIIAATHTFDRTITDTLVVDNVDVVLKAERASLIIASTIFDRPCSELVAPDKLLHLTRTSPNLLPPSADDTVQDRQGGGADDDPAADAPATAS